MTIIAQILSIKSFGLMQMLLFQSSNSNFLAFLFWL